jgi:CsoR family transcriptional regulator, copper-sensing transcriptional repressor
MPKGHPKDNSKERSIIHQLKIAKGHLNKVIDMMEEGSYCIDVVHQSLAVQAALRKIDQKILRNHMETCVADAIRNGKDKEVIDEMMRVFEKK